MTNPSDKEITAAWRARLDATLDKAQTECVEPRYVAGILLELSLEWMATTAGVACMGHVLIQTTETLERAYPGDFALAREALRLRADTEAAARWAAAMEREPAGNA